VLRPPAFVQFIRLVALKESLAFSPWNKTAESDAVKFNFAKCDLVPCSLLFAARCMNDNPMLMRVACILKCGLRSLVLAV
jgi:hypothetical protein